MQKLLFHVSTLHALVSANNGYSPRRDYDKANADTDTKHSWLFLLTSLVS